MKKKTLILILMIILASFIFNVNGVLAYELKTRAWNYHVDSDGKPDMIYRTYITPYPSTVTDYHNTNSSEWVWGDNGWQTYDYNGSQWAKWIYESTKLTLPSRATFVTIGYQFHTAPLSTYTNDANSGYAYNATGNNYISEPVSSVDTIVSNSYAQRATITNAYDGNKVFYTTYKAKYTPEATAYGTKWLTWSITAGDVDTDYRYTIVKFNNKNIYIDDEVFYNPYLLGLVNAAKSSGQTNSCYVSAINATESWIHGSGRGKHYELAYTAAEFFSAHGHNWSASSKGIVNGDKALGSAANMYDNQIIFPAMSKRTILVRHINIGNGEVINQSIVDNASRIYSNDFRIYANNGTTIYGSDTYHPIYQESYVKALDIEQGFEKYALADSTTYRYIGSNYGIASSESGALESLYSKIRAGKMDAPTSSRGVGIIGKDISSDDDYVIIDFYYTERDKDVQVNHIYVDSNGYVKAIQEQSIIPNTYAYINGTQVNRTNNDVYMKEVYSKKLGYDVNVRVADSLLGNDKVSYQGYRTYNTINTTDIQPGVQVRDLASGTEVALNNEAVQVNFYYTYKDEAIYPEPPKDIGGKVMVELTDGQDDVKGVSCNDSSENYNVKSIPSGSEVKVGINDIPRYMVGAITTEYVNPINNFEKINLKLSVTMGYEQKTIEYKDLPYRPAYFKITDMAVYKLKDVTIYDAEHGYDGTNGKSLFDWTDGYLANMPSMEDVSVELTGVNGNKIDSTSDSSINNIDNYVTVKVNDKYGNTTLEGNTKPWLPIQMLTPAEFNSVNATNMEADPNKDFVIDSNDKTYAINHLAGLLEDRNNKQAIEKEKEAKYDAALEERTRLFNKYEADKKELERLKGIYDEETTKSNNYMNAKTRLEEDLEKLEQEKLALEQDEKTLIDEKTALEQDEKTLIDEKLALEQEKIALEQDEKTLIDEKLALEQDKKTLIDEKTALEQNIKIWEQHINTLEQDIETLEQELITLKKELDTLEQELETLTALNNELYISWQKSIEKRSALKEAANCTDQVDEDTYIKLDDDEKEALKECADRKMEYKKHLEEEIVENAEKEYNESSKNVENKEKEISDKKNEISIKETSISDKEMTIINKEQEISNNTDKINDKEKEISNKANKISEKEQEISAKNKEVNAKLKEISIKAEEINEKVKEVNAKSDEINSKAEQIVNKNIEIRDINFLIEAAKRSYQDHYDNEYKKAQNNFETYRDNDYTNSEKAYNDYKNAEYVEKALAENVKAATEAILAENAYDSYKTYHDNLIANFEQYKALYDEFKSLENADNKKIASTLGLEMTIKVQSMSANIKVGEQSQNLVSASTPYIYTTKLSDYMNIKYGDEPILPAGEPNIGAEVYSGIGATKATIDDYNNKSVIDSNKLNGITWLAGKAEYEAEVVVGGETSAVGMEDTIYYETGDYKNNDTETTNVFYLATPTITKEYKVDTSTTDTSKKYANVDPLNIYTPISVKARVETDFNKIIDQTNDTSLNATMIQANTPFKVYFSNDGAPIEGRYKLSNTEKYGEGYFIKFDFDVHNVKLQGKLYKNGNVIKANEWIGPIYKAEKDTYMEAQPYVELADDAVGKPIEDYSKYWVRGYAYNITDTILRESIKYNTITEMTDSLDVKDLINNICDTSSYLAEIKAGVVVVVNRLYDFRVTDVKDIAWKNVFRKSTSSNTNEHKGIAYYSGTRKWDTKTEQTNKLVNRTTTEIGRSPLRILPIGPYKNTDGTYIKAPKLGYRFSFDMKVTGSYYNDDNTPKDKKVNIATKFYYISKDGQKLYYEYNPSVRKEGIYLFYKNSSGKYVRIDNNGGGYNLTFTPNDGYRYIQDNSKSTLSTKSVSLGSLRKLELKYNMATVTNNGAAITYYGEYKLPNSTIAVHVDKNGNYDINKPLKNGYIGVVFDITAVAGTTDENKDITLSYSKDTKKNIGNSSQWDYEAYLGNIKDSQELTNPLSMKLESGTWKIDNDTYNAIKGTVILYDIDERAATDYE